MKKLKTTLTLACICVAPLLHAQQQTTPANITDTTAQPKTKIKEYGIGFTGLNSYSLQYRWGNPKLIYRLNANMSITGFSNNTTDNTNYPQNNGSNYSFDNTVKKTPLTLTTGAGFSILRLKQINPKFGFLWGGIAGITYSYTTGQTTDTDGTKNNSGPASLQTQTVKTNSQTLQPYIGFVLGIYYKFTPSFIVYAEISPNIYYAYTHATSSTIEQNLASNTNSQTNTNLTNNSNFGLSGLTNSGAMVTLAYRITR